MKNSENEIVPRKYKGGEEDLWRVSKFVGKKGKREESEEDKENIPTPPTKKRRSERAKIITPDKRDKVMAALLSVRPKLDSNESQLPGFQDSQILDLCRSVDSSDFPLAKESFWPGLGEAPQKTKLDATRHARRLPAPRATRT